DAPRHHGWRDAQLPRCFSKTSVLYYSSEGPYVRYHVHSQSPMALRPFRGRIQAPINAKIGSQIPQNCVNQPSQASIE
ncbi:hypothetical protein, partial [Mesorhizobium sp. M8A.F.Ca.ET.181.01.1.1]|uniref:hypothetical protein n=1 Tax=Mesorhizobium sp. M8A.F.Ca.ET.181.01.1.1 TaxID=2563963 RepID=UPI001FDF059E